MVRRVGVGNEVGPEYGGGRGDSGLGVGESAGAEAREEGNLGPIEGQGGCKSEARGVGTGMSQLEDVSLDSEELSLLIRRKASGEERDGNDVPDSLSEEE